MGDRYEWEEDCDNCGGKGTVECYDAPSCIMWSRICHNCGWRDPRNYYEAPGNIIYLITEPEAREKGLIFDCPGGDGAMNWWEKERYGVCMSCHQNKEHEQKKDVPSEGDASGI